MKAIKRVISLLLVGLILLGSAVTVTAEEAFTIPCPEYNFTALDGSAVTNTTHAGKPSLLLFFQVGCPNSAAAIQALTDADWIDPSRLSVTAIEISGADNAQLKTYADTYGSSHITFCSDSNNTVWSLLSATGHSGGSVSLPVLFVVDKTGIIRRRSLGATSEISMREMLVGYVEGLTMAPSTAVTVKGTLDYVKAFEVLETVNQERQAANLAPLTMNSTLLEAAMTRAAECSVQYSHTRPNGNSAASVVDAAVFRENIAIGYTSSAAVMDGWMNSDGHKNNILNTDCTQIGIGAFYQNNTLTWVQLFTNDLGTPPAESRNNTDSTISVTVLNTALRFGVSRSTVSLGMGETQTVYGQVYPADGFTTRLDSSCLTYSSDHPEVATVSADGTVTATGSGGATVTVSLNGSSEKATVSVTVSQTGSSASQTATTRPQNTTSTIGSQTTGTHTTSPSSTATGSQTTATTTATQASGGSSVGSSVTTIHTQATSTAKTEKPDQTTIGSSHSGITTSTAPTIDASALTIFAQGDGIVIKALPGTFAENTVWELKPLSPIDGLTEKHIAFSITATDGVLSVLPTGTIYVTFTVPQEFDLHSAAVMRVAEDGSTETVVSVVDEPSRTVTATLEYLGTYVVAETEQETGTQPDPLPPTEQDPAQTNHPAVMILVIVAVLIVLAGGAVWYFLYVKRSKQE